MEEVEWLCLTEKDGVGGFRRTWVSRRRRELEEKEMYRSGGSSRNGGGEREGRENTEASDVTGFGPNVCREEERKKKWLDGK